jgi:hypothetical protein
MNTARAILEVWTVSAASSQPLFLVLLLASRLVVLALDDAWTFKVPPVSVTRRWPREIKEQRSPVLFAVQYQ